MDREKEANPIPLCVDLDGTLILTDSLHEQALLLLRENPLGFFSALIRLPRGIPAFKQHLAKQVDLPLGSLPYNEKFISYLRSEADKGRRLLLVTAADRSIADRIAEHLGLFETTLATDGEQNLKAYAKVTAIRQYTGCRAFDYAGDSSADVPVWKESSSAILVNTSTTLEKKMRNDNDIRISHAFPAKPSGVRTILRAVRAHQWVKNLLVLAPLFLSHQLTDLPKLRISLMAMFVLCMAASATYIINDLLDISSDRSHPRKRTRPFASGDLSIRVGVILASILLVSAIGFGLWLPATAQLFVLGYFVSSSLYTVYLKRMLILDIVTLAGLYTLRILYGGAAANIEISPWTLAFSLFLFISLAVCKRLTELRDRAAAEELETKGTVPGRAYLLQDMNVLTALGCASGFVAIQVLTLYLQSPDVIALYRRPALLWLLVPALAYWIGRIMVLAHRGQIHDDPIVFTAYDKVSWAVAFFSALVIGGSLPD